jgi:hypothetical protein
MTRPIAILTLAALVLFGAANHTAAAQSGDPELGRNKLKVAIVPHLLRAETFGALPAQSLPYHSAWLERMKEQPLVNGILQLALKNTIWPRRRSRQTGT